MSGDQARAHDVDMWRAEGNRVVIGSKGGVKASIIVVDPFVAGVVVKYHAEAVDELTAERDVAVRATAELRAQIVALVSALERTEENFRLAVAGKPVRDMCENLAENRSALLLAGSDETEADDE